jgi:hypothetical protein
MWSSTDTVMLPARIATAGSPSLGHRKSMVKRRMAAAADPSHPQVLTKRARRMEQRICHLEGIVDSQAPDWRSRSLQAERAHGTH